MVSLFLNGMDSGLMLFLMHIHHTDNHGYCVNLTNPFDLDGDEDRFPAEINLRLSPNSKCWI